MRRILLMLSLFAAGLSASVANAQGTASRPTTEAQAVQLAGGASSISETHGSWTVNCQIVSNTKICSSSFQQFDGKNQRIFAVELSPRGEAAVGNAALPFGLALQKGINLSIDDKPLGEIRPFSTCILAGCLVPLTFESDSLELLGKGVTLKIKGVAIETDREIEFSVPLAGFASALARAGALLAE